MIIWTYKLVEVAWSVFAVVPDNDIQSTARSTKLAVMALQIEAPIIWRDDLSVNYGPIVKILVILRIVVDKYHPRIKPCMMSFRHNHERQLRTPYFSDFWDIAVLAESVECSLASPHDLVFLFVEHHPVLTFAYAIPVEEDAVGQLGLPAGFLEVRVHLRFGLPSENTFLHHSLEVRDVLSISVSEIILIWRASTDFFPSFLESSRSEVVTGKVIMSRNYGSHRWTSRTLARARHVCAGNHGSEGCTGRAFAWSPCRDGMADSLHFEIDLETEIR